MFQMQPSLFLQLVTTLRPHLTRQNTQMRPIFKVELRLATFSLWTGGLKYVAIAKILGIGRISITPIIRRVSRELCEQYREVISLPRSKKELYAIMDGFKIIAGLLYCIGTIGRSHKRWHSCPVRYVIKSLGPNRFRRSHVFEGYS